MVDIDANLRFLQLAPNICFVVMTQVLLQRPDSWFVSCLCEGNLLQWAELWLGIGLFTQQLMVEIGPNKLT